MRRCKSLDWSAVSDRSRFDRSRSPCRSVLLRESPGNRPVFLSNCKNAEKELAAECHPPESIYRCRRRPLRTLGSREETDRKSTRLNSSHITISYAVFCLKK